MAKEFVDEDEASKYGTPVASALLLFNEQCSWFTFAQPLDLCTFVEKSALSQLRALGGTFCQNMVGGGTQTFYGIRVISEKVYIANFPLY